MSNRLTKLRALAADPAATDAERALACEHIARMIRILDGVGTEDDRLIDVDDYLIATMDQAMSRLVGMKGVHAAARRRAAEHRLGRDVARAWLDSRGQPLTRGTR